MDREPRPAVNQSNDDGDPGRRSDYAVEDEIMGGALAEETKEWRSPART